MGNRFNISSILPQINPGVKLGLDLRPEFHPSPSARIIFPPLKEIQCKHEWPRNAAERLPKSGFIHPTVIASLLRFTQGCSSWVTWLELEGHNDPDRHNCQGDSGRDILWEAATGPRIDLTDVHPEYALEWMKMVSLSIRQEGMNHAQQRVTREGRTSLDMLSVSLLCLAMRIHL
jgi:hypothetical protein